MNFLVKDVDNAISLIKKKYSKGAVIDKNDGLSFAFSDWRFNLRKSNTEPLLRLNLETMGNKKKLAEETEKLSNLLSNA